MHLSQFVDDIKLGRCVDMLDCKKGYVDRLDQ